jgi:hypothetical protein
VSKLTLRSNRDDEGIIAQPVLAHGERQFKVLGTLSDFQEIFQNLLHMLLPHQSVLLVQSGRKILSKNSLEWFQLRMPAIAGNLYFHYIITLTASHLFGFFLTNSRK